jgi:hypothetical protein
VSSWLLQTPSLTNVRRGPSSSELGAISSVCCSESLQTKWKTNYQHNLTFEVVRTASMKLT